MSRKKHHVREWPIGARVTWPAPPSIRIGAHGVARAPSAVAIVSMCVNGTPILRFVDEAGAESEPFEPVSMDDAKAAP